MCRIWVCVEGLRIGVKELFEGAGVLCWLWLGGRMCCVGLSKFDGLGWIG